MSISHIINSVMDAIGQISMNVRVGLLSVMRMLSVSILMVAFTATVKLDTLEVVILENVMVCFFECKWLFWTKP